MHNVRIGEAQNPGPSKATVAIVNPTSLANKMELFRSFISDHHLSMICCAETSATQTVQRMFSNQMHKMKFSSHWSTPMPPHKLKLDDTDSLRGKAGGVSVHTSLPCRAAKTHVALDWVQGTRLLHVVVRLGTLWCQIVVLYGFAANQYSRKASTNELFSKAIELTDSLPIPAVYMGDFNVDMDELLELPQLQDHGYLTVQQLFQEQRGYQMPCTCKDATRPDSAIFHPLLKQRISNIRVDFDGLFDSHHPILFDVEVPEDALFTPRYRFPATWTDFGVTKDDLHRACNTGAAVPSCPQTIQDWGTAVEAVVSAAIAHEHHSKPHLQLPPRLPKRCQGQCQPVKRVLCPTVPLSKSSRHGSYEPSAEPVTFRTRKLLTQLRRVESLMRKVRKHSSSYDGTVKVSHCQEWRGIRAHRILGRDFCDWVQQVPELGPCARNVPEWPWLFDLLQHLRFLLEAQITAEVKMRSDIVKARHKADVKDGHSRETFATVRGPGKPTFQVATTILDETAIPVPSSGGDWTCYVAKAASFISHAPVFVDHRPAKILHQDDHSVVVLLREYLARVGLSCSATGILLGAERDGLSLLHSALPDLQGAVKHSWNQHLLLLHTTRKHIGVYSPMNCAATIQLLDRFTDPQQRILLREIAGGFQTKSQQSVWDEDTPTTCPWCQEHDDTREHRIFHCSVFDDIRVPYRDLLDDIQDSRPHLCCLPTLREDGEAYLVRLLHDSMPVPDMPSACQTAIAEVKQVATPVFFTDGSSAFQSSTTRRFCSFSVILDLCCSDAQRRVQADRFLSTGQLPTTLTPAAVGRLKGRQSIERAELFAILWILQRTEAACIHSDSAYACDWIAKLHVDRSAADDPTCSDFDLLQQIRLVLRPSHQVVKIKAHQDCHAISDLVQCYLALGNTVADTHAVTTNKSLFPDVAAHLWRFASTGEEEFRFMRQYWTFLLDLNMARARVQPAPEDVAAETLQPRHLLSQLRDWRASGSWRFPAEIDEQWLSWSPWGNQVMNAAGRWLRSCDWPDSDDHCPGDVALGLSWSEVAVALALLLGQWLPVKRVGPDGKLRLVQPSSAHDVEFLGITLQEQAAAAAQVIGLYQALVPQDTAPQLERKKVKALMVYGCNLRLAGITRRPSFEVQSSVINVLQPFLPGLDDKLCGLPLLPMDVPFTVWPEDSAMFEQEWLVTHPAVTRAKKEVKKAKKLLASSV
eukprot:Skav221105  [mRNA]  locus=scaffold693:340472:345676:- [translate_table: standard]